MQIDADIFTAATTLNPFHEIKIDILFFLFHVLISLYMYVYNRFYNKIWFWWLMIGIDFSSVFFHFCGGCQEKFVQVPLNALLKMNFFFLSLSIYLSLSLSLSYTLSSDVSLIFLSTSDSDSLPSLKPFDFSSFLPLFLYLPLFLFFLFEMV